MTRRLIRTGSVTFLSISLVFNLIFLGQMLALIFNRSDISGKEFLIAFGGMFAGSIVNFLIGYVLYHLFKRYKAGDMKKVFLTVAREIAIFVIGAMLSFASFLLITAMFDLFNSKIMSWAGYILGLGAGFWVITRVMKLYDKK